MTGSRDHPFLEWGNRGHLQFQEKGLFGDSAQSRKHWPISVLQFSSLQFQRVGCRPSVTTSSSGDRSLYVDRALVGRCCALTGVGLKPSDRFRRTARSQVHGNHLVGSFASGRKPNGSPTYVVDGHDRSPEYHHCYQTCQPAALSSLVSHDVPPENLLRSITWLREQIFPSTKWIWRPKTLTRTLGAPALLLNNPERSTTYNTI